MRAILEDPRSGQVSVYETPEPELRAGGILVRTHFSVISAGTERAKLEAGQKSLMGKALQRPDLVQQVIDYARANGVWAAYHKVRSEERRVGKESGSRWSAYNEKKNDRCDLGSELH